MTSPRDKLLTDEQLTEALSAKTGERVTEEAMESYITEVKYIQVPGTTVVICHIGLANGFSVRGEAACVDPDNFDPEIGKRIAYDDAFSKLWPLFGFLLAELRMMRELEQEDATKAERAERPEYPH